MSRLVTLSDVPISKALRDLGWREGENLVIERRYSSGKDEPLPGLAAELVQLKVDVIVAIGSAAARAAKNATATIPIVLDRVTDPVRMGLVQSFARPGGNITGGAAPVTELGPKRLELLRDAIPATRRVAVLWEQSFALAAIVPALKEVETAAHSLRMDLVPVGVQGPEDIEGAFQAIKRHRADGVIGVGGRMLTQYRQRLAETAIRAGLPMIGYRRELAEAGVLLTYGLDALALRHQVAAYVARILRGKNPADLPIDQASRYELVVNLKTAKALGLTIPPSLLARADQVIE